MVREKTSTIKIFSSGNVVVNSDDKSLADSVFAETSRQLLKAHRCTGCGICIKACPVNAVSIDNGHVIINKNCIHCGKCTDSCVVLRYENKL
jgi:phosphoadenosine phosphosulfate reductase